MEHTSDITIEGKKAIVTGAASGIGKQLSLGFARAGADVACVDINLEGAQETADAIVATGQNTVVVEEDVSDAAAVARMVDATVTAFGRIDVLMHCAGINAQGDTEDFDDALWRRIIDVNLIGTYLSDKAVCNQMIRQGGGGSIINTSSFCSTRIVKTNHQSAYYASKAGVRMLTQALAVEWTRHNVRVNCIAPGFTATPMFVADRERNKDDSVLLDQVPMGRFQDPAELVGVAIFLASDAASYVTGHELLSDGGRACL